MARLAWTRAALADLARLHNFLAPKNPDAARRAVQAIRVGLNQLVKHPQIGRRVDDDDPEIREWIIRFGNDGYIARYQYNGRDAVVLAVRHAREAGY